MGCGNSTGMRISSLGASRPGTVALFAAASIWLPPACKDGASPGEPPADDLGGIFGGTGGIGGIGGIGEAVPRAGGGGTGGTASAGAGNVDDACQNTPPGELASIDDFDDGNSQAAYEAEREAYWFTVADGSDGTLEPTGPFLPVAGGYRNTKSAHVSASGFSTWGAELTLNISHKGAVRCPFDASSFRGLRFVARGSGRVRVQVAMPGVVDKDYGGTCDSKAGQVCYDIHGVFVTLGEEYRAYELPWSSFQQRGYGVSVPFDQKTLTSIHFSMEKEELPVDLWLDQVELWDGTSVSEGEGGAGGAGGASGAPAEGGQAAGGAPSPEAGGAE